MSSGYGDAATAGVENYLDGLFALIRASSDSEQSENQELELGTRIGDFQVVRRLASGGMGDVYIAQQISIKRLVALKICRVGISSNARERFSTEAQVLGRISHPNVVPVLTAGEEEDRPFLAMEYIDGPSLASVIESLGSGGSEKTASELVARLFDEQHEIPAATTRSATDGMASDTPPPGLTHGRTPDAMGVDGVVGDVSSDEPPPGPVTIDRRYYLWVGETMAAVCDGLSALHEAGIVHRDIKPANIIVDRGGTPRVVDLGLARSESDATVTSPGEFVGTPAYASPEQAEGGLGEVESPSDVYSIGVTLFELLTLARPTEAETPREFLAKIRHGQVRFVRQVDPNVPWELEAIVDKCLSLDPEARYADASEVQKDLRAYLEHRPLAAKRATPVRKAVRAIRRRRGLAPALALAFVAICLLGVIGVNYLERREQEMAEAATRHEQALAEAAEQKYRASLDRGDVLAYEVFAGMFPRWDPVALKQRAQEAIGEYTTALSIKKNEVWPLVQRGRLHLLVQDTDRAKDDFICANQLRPTFISIRRFLELCGRENDRTKAIRKPNHPFDLYWSARIAYWFNDDFVAAEKLFKEAIERQPEFYWARIERFHPVALARLQSRDRLQLARRELDHANRLRPDLPFAREHQLSLRISDGDRSSTIREVQSLVEDFGSTRARRHRLAALYKTDTKYAEIFRLLASDRDNDARPLAPTTWLAALYGSKQFRDAEQEARSVLTRNPENTMGHFHLLRSLAETDEESALVYARRLASKNATDPTLAVVLWEWFRHRNLNGESISVAKEFLLKGTPAEAAQRWKDRGGLLRVVTGGGIEVHPTDAVSVATGATNHVDLFAMMYANITIKVVRELITAGEKEAAVRISEQSKKRMEVWLRKEELTYTAPVVRALFELGASTQLAPLLAGGMPDTTGAVRPWLPIHDATSMVIEHERRSLAYAWRNQPEKALAHARVADQFQELRSRDSGSLLPSSTIEGLLVQFGRRYELAIRARAKRLAGKQLAVEEYSALAESINEEDGPEAAVHVLDEATERFPMHMRFPVSRMELAWSIGDIGKAKNGIREYCRLALGTKNQMSSVSGVGNHPAVQSGAVVENLFLKGEMFASKVSTVAFFIGDGAVAEEVNEALRQMNGNKGLQMVLAAYRIGALCSSEDLVQVSLAAKHAVGFLQETQGMLSGQPPGAVVPNAVPAEVSLAPFGTKARANILWDSVLNIGLKAAWDAQDYESLFALVRLLEWRTSQLKRAVRAPLGLRLFCRMYEDGRNGVAGLTQRLVPRRVMCPMPDRSLLAASLAWTKAMEGEVAVARRSLARAGVYAFMSVGKKNPGGLLNLPAVFTCPLEVDDSAIGMQWCLLQSTARIPGVNDVDVAATAIRSGRSVPPLRRALFDSLFDPVPRNRVRALLEVMGPDPAQGGNVARYFGTRLPRLRKKGRTLADVHGIKDPEMLRIVKACYAIGALPFGAPEREVRAAKAVVSQLCKELRDGEAVSPEAFCVMALSAWHASEFDMAKKWIDKAIEEDPTWGFAFEVRAVVDVNSNKLRMATDGFVAAAKRTPQKIGWLLSLAAWACRHQGSKSGFAEAEKYCDAAIAADIGNPIARSFRFQIRLILGKHKAAAEDALIAVASSNSAVTPLNDAAWFLATSPVKEVRNGKVALRLARRACARTMWRYVPFLDTVAAAHAECGQFDEAVKWQQKVVEAKELFPEAEREKVVQRLQMYRDRKPFRQSAPE